MRDPWPEEIERARLQFKRSDPYFSEDGDRFGAFYLKGLKIIANDAFKDSGWWEHVSISLESRTPTWEEMCLVKDLFWRDDEVVLQFHPAKSDYVNCHPYTLHLWRHKFKYDKIPLPPSGLVGPK